MIDYETFCKIRAYHESQGLKVAQIARELGLHPCTVTKWVRMPQYRRQPAAPRRSKLDPFKPQIIRLLESHPYSAAQIFQRLREVGYPGATRL